MASKKRSRQSCQDKDKLYRVRVVEEDGDRFKVHYIGYSKNENEWKTRDELVLLQDGDGPQDEAITSEDIADTLCTVCQPFSLYRDLGNRIKSSLQSS